MSYTQEKAIIDTRRHLKDTTQNVWTDDDIKQFINDAITLIRQSVPLYFSNLYTTPYDVDGVMSYDINIEEDYALLIPLFCAARCFEQDEQHYRAVQKMNEFEARMASMITIIMESDAYAQILEESGGSVDVVRDVYFNTVSIIDTSVGLL